jgi:glycosyltransferase involved in cell wall biosynthesis
VAKADLHIHSRYSDRSAEWIARRFAFPDSYTQPAELYAALKQRGMDFVTITDHDRIEGCLEIADRPGTFISEQVSTVFPEDRCKVSLLVWGITENQHHEIGGLRGNIYELQKYLAQHAIAHAVSHPLYRLDDKLGVAHLEKLVLLFKCFEGINGLRDALFSDIARFILERLTPAKIDEFANRHNLQPTHDEPWKKVLTAGSDDHGGMFPGAALTETEDCATAAEFLKLVRNGQCRPCGVGGSPLAFSHGLYNTIYGFVGDKFLKGNKQSYGLLEKVFSRFMEGRDPTQFSLAEKLGMLAQGVASGKIFELAKPANASLWSQFATYYKEHDIKALIAQETKGVAEPERRSFLMANLLANQFAYRLFTQFLKEVASGNLIESVRDVSTLAPVLLLLSPYIYAFQSQAAPREWLREACSEMTGRIAAPLRNLRRAWFTDTLEDVNGVATTIQKMTAAAIKSGRDMVVVTSRTSLQLSGIPIKNFRPIGEFELPEYELQKLSFPPILQILDYIQRERFSELIISTPGPVGLTALIAGKMLGLRMSGIYHTDFPQYVRILTDDSFLETLTWDYMHWFYSQFDRLYVNSERYRQAWTDRGIPSETIAILPRGLDNVLFHPSRRDAETRERFGARDQEVVLLYVGRISKEKNLDVLADAYRRLRHSDMPVRLAMVGDGPYLKELREKLPEACYTGYLTGLDLAKAFASADVFAFPSTTDTFGNVVLEAMASGLPAVVSDEGGPPELVKEGATGCITKGLDVADFTRALRTLAGDATLRRAMGANAVRSVQDRDWIAAVEEFWSLSPE